MNTPVSLGIAKLLKGKGFDEYCKLCVEEGDETPLPFDSGNKMHRNSLHPYYSAPIIADVIMWLYEKHGIWVEVVHRTLWAFSIKNVKENVFELERLEYNSPTKAYEAAIEYTLNNLI